MTTVDQEDRQPVADDGAVDAELDLDLGIDGDAEADLSVPADIAALLAGDDPEDLRGIAIDPDATPPSPVVTREQIELLALEAERRDAAGATPGREDVPGADRPTPSVDPRIRARRLDVVRAQGRRRLRIAAVVAGVAVLILAALAVTRSPLLAVKDIRVTGADRTDSEDLDGVLAGVRGSSMVWIDLDELAVRLEALPWVRRVSIVREWPNGLVIDVGERRPVAIYAAEDGRWRVLDATGRVVVLSDGRPIGFPEIIGDQTALERGEVATSEALVAAAGLAAVLPDSLAETLAAIRLDPVSGLVLELRPKGFVVIGSTDDVRGKLLRALTVLERCGAGSFEVLDAQVSPVTLSPPSACPTLTRTSP